MEAAAPRHGLDAADVLSSAELPGDLFARERAALSTEEYFRLFRAADAACGDGRLALRAASALSVEAFDPPIFAAICSPDLNTALTRMATYKRLVCAMSLRVEISDENTRLTLEWLDKTVAPPPCLQHTELAFLVQLARIATRRRIVPLALTAPNPPEEGPAYEEYFGARIDYGPSLSLLFSAQDARAPFLTANAGMWSFFEAELKRRLNDLNESATISERVKAALLELLPSGEASMGSVAKRLGTSTRTLQRRLKDERTSFQLVLDQTREALAHHYLKTTRLTGSEIAFLLGFEDPNSFFRAFNHWTGRTPEQARSMLASV